MGEKNQEFKEDVLQMYEEHVKLCMTSKGSELKIEFLKLDPETVRQQHYSFWQNVKPLMMLKKF